MAEEDPAFLVQLKRPGPGVHPRHDLFFDLRGCTSTNYLPGVRPDGVEIAERRRCAPCWPRSTSSIRLTTTPVWIWDTAEFDRFSFYFFLGLNVFLGLIGSFTLGVAGIGVANIMYIRGAGAYQRNRREESSRSEEVQHSLSSSLWRRSSLLASVVHRFCDCCRSRRVLQLLPIKEFVGTPEISGEVVIAHGLILSLIGLLAGLMPARKAANLNVVDCLRT